jgi:hypothetical protein
MSTQRKLVFGVVLLAGLVATVMVVRTIGCRGPTGRLKDPEGDAWTLSFKCRKCGTEFAGYEISIEPGTKGPAQKRRYRRPGDAEWVPETDGAAVARIKTVSCPKCKAGMRDLTLVEKNLPGAGP